MSFNSRKDYTLSCITAAVGTLLNDDYYARDFESLIGFETLDQAVCTNFINFVKDMKHESCVQYATRPNFNEYLQSRKGPDVNTLTDRENDLCELIFNRIEYNRQNNNSELKEPESLYRSLAEARKKINFSKTLQNLSENDTFAQDAVTWPDEYCEGLQNTLGDSITDYNSKTEQSSMYYGDEISKYYAEKLTERHEGETYSFHNPVMDSLVTEGPTPGHGGIIAGSTGMGKSTLCLNVINDCINADIPTMYFPIEMGLENTVDRLAALRSGVPFRMIRNIGKANEDTTDLEKKLLHEINGLRAHPNFAIIEDANISVRKLRNYIKRFQAKLPGKKFCIVFIDLLLMIKEFYDDDGNMAQQIERAINKLDIMAKELGIHYVGVVQLNRSIEGESSKVLTEQALNKLRPTRSSIKNSSALLERARWAITIFRKRYFADLLLTEEEAQQIDDVAEIQLMKANDEAIGRRYMTFDGPTFKMTYNPDYGKSANGF